MKKDMFIISMKDLATVLDNQTRLTICDNALVRHSIELVNMIDDLMAIYDLAKSKQKKRKLFYSVINKWTLLDSHVATLERLVKKQGEYKHEHETLVIMNSAIKERIKNIM